MKTMAVVVTYNRLALLKECLQALQQQAPDIPVLVVNNASTDGTGEWLVQQQKKQPGLQVLQAKENLGGAGGFAWGMEEAWKQGADWIWIMDDDTIVQPESLPALLEAVQEHPQGLFFSSRAVWTDGTDNKMNAHRLLEKENGICPVRCREATFVSLLVSAEAIGTYGLPIADFFIWGDDIEYTRRLSHRGEGWYVPASVVLHKTKTNAGSDIVHDDPARLQRYRYAYRNEVFIAREEGLFRKLRQLAKISYHTLKVLVSSPDARMEKIRLIWSASRQGLSFDPKIRIPDAGERVTACRKEEQA